MMIWFWLVIATLAIQIPNLWAMSRFATDPSFKTAVIIGFFCLPASWVTTVGFAYYYGIGFAKYSYPTMVVAAFGLGIIIAYAIQAWVLKSKAVLWVDYLSITLILIGVLAMIFRTELHAKLS
jgi:hypothetical protein